MTLSEIVQEVASYLDGVSGKYFSKHDGLGDHGLGRNFSILDMPKDIFYVFADEFFTALAGGLELFVGRPVNYVERRLGVNSSPVWIFKSSR